MSLFSKHFSLSLVIIGSLIAGIAAAQDAQGTKQEEPVEQDPEMLPLIYEKHYRCPECHRVSAKLVGPAFKEVAAKRQGHPWAHTLLAKKIWNGGSGEYGASEMPHMTEVSEEDVQTIVTWILSLR